MAMAFSLRCFSIMHFLPGNRRRIKSENQGIFTESSERPTLLPTLVMQMAFHSRSVRTPQGRALPASGRKPTSGLDGDRDGSAGWFAMFHERFGFLGFCPAR